MIVYGDHVVRMDPLSALEELAERVRELNNAPRGSLPPLERHGAYVAALIRAGAIAQGILDGDFHSRGDVDHFGALSRACSELLAPLAKAVVASWESGFGRVVDVDLRLPVQQLGALTRRAHLPCKIAEGFAFYALYPETYAAAARLLSRRNFRIIGIRSIGLPLAAVAGAALGGGHPVHSLRPVGHPFARSVSLDAESTRFLLSVDTKDPPSFLIVDEGPGLSGSSFTSVTSFLEQHAVPTGRIQLLPSHSNPPGPASSSEVREAWNRVAKHAVSFDQIFLRDDGRHHLSRWFEDITGPIIELEELSGGLWRRRRFLHPRSWPGVNPQWERRKFLVVSARGTYLLKFMGLGTTGTAAYERAQTLANAGFAPKVEAFRYGYLLQPWIGDSRTLTEAHVERREFVHRLAEYLSFRAQRFAAVPGLEDGASVQELLRMAVHNTEMALGPAAARQLPPCEDDLTAFRAESKPIHIDGRLHAWEWLVKSNGEIFKTDGVDHSCSHDLVGCQDLGWDLAGATVEHSLSASEARQLILAVGELTGRRAHPKMLCFFRRCYLAFQLGQQTLAAQSVTWDLAEQARLASRATFYKSILERELERPLPFP